MLFAAVNYSSEQMESNESFTIQKKVYLVCLKMKVCILHYIFPWVVDLNHLC